MENKEIKAEEKKIESKQESYKTAYEMRKEDISTLPVLKCSMIKTVSKKTSLKSYTFVGFVHGLELKDKKFNSDKFVLALLEKKMKMEEIDKATKVDLNARYRPVKGQRKDNGEWFYGVDIFVSKTSRPRIFFNDNQLKTLQLQDINLNYVEVEIEEDLDSFDEDFE